MSDPRLLIVRLGAIGDVIHTLPALMDLRSHYPESEIDWLVEPASAPLLRNSGALDQVIEISTRKWRRALHSPNTWQEVIGTAQRLRRRGYTAALDFQGLWKSACWARASGAKEVLGAATADLRESSSRIFYGRQAEPAGNVHRIERNRSMISLLGVSPRGPACYPDRLWSDADQARVEVLLRGLPRDFVVLNPGAGWLTKLWPAERFGELASRIHSGYGYGIVCTWGPGEEALMAAVQQHAGPCPILPLKLSLSEFACLVRRARMFIGGDTGPMHIAAAYRVPAFCIFGPTTLAQNGPYQTLRRVTQHLLPCSHCYRRTCWHHSCMKFLETSEVWQAFQEFERELAASQGYAGAGRMKFDER
ncbi:MAG: lipopolysaccharide heptosyltransferase I [Acidobacteria bacterium]|nr:lipopolysaccharide heptosyltransferase I [Acidobacteriota bacterium]